MKNTVATPQKNFFVLTQNQDKHLLILIEKYAKYINNFLHSRIIGEKKTKKQRGLFLFFSLFFSRTKSLIVEVMHLITHC
jgi:hypothetical protein